MQSPVPQPPAVKEASEPQSLRQKLTFGLRYVWQQPGLKALLLVTVLFTFAHDLGGALQQPMILARTNGSATAIASVSAAAGLGGILGLSSPRFGVAPNAVSEVCSAASLVPDSARRCLAGGYSSRFGCPPKSSHRLTSLC
ncbi:MAG: hypothetical protein AAGH78_00410 [Cyanobacteria bacterium P01_H01_bin.58]